MTHNASSNISYKPLPELSPYTSTDRYHRVKETHKFYIKKLHEYARTSERLKVLDAGCGNGELLHVIKNEFPHWSLKGMDPTPEFIECARSFDGLAGVEFAEGAIKDITGLYDIVLCTGVLQIFSDISDPLFKLLEVTKPGGYVFCDGLFNKWDIEVRIQYCDNSNPKSAGQWRSDWNQHTQKGISACLNGKVSKLCFCKMEMNADLAPNRNIHTRQFTFRDINGENIITNGTNLMLNKTMLIVNK